MKFICQTCNKEHSPAQPAYQCDCGGLFKADFDCNAIDFGALPKMQADLWRYIDSMPFEDEAYPKLVTMGEGFTPLIPLNPKSPNLLAKCDYFMPTLSFKDR